MSLAQSHYIKVRVSQLDYLGCVWEYNFVEKKNVILNQIVENESFENCVFKKLRFENEENCVFKKASPWF
jgi:hypothetical protein